MKVRPVIEVTELEEIVRALRACGSNQTLVTRLDFLLYKTKAEKPPAQPVTSRASPLELYQTCDSLQEAIAVHGKPLVFLALRAKPQKELSTEELEFFGRYMAENL